MNDVRRQTLFLIERMARGHFDCCRECETMADAILHMRPVVPHGAKLAVFEEAERKIMKREMNR